LDYGRHNYEVRNTLFNNATLPYEALRHILDMGHNDSVLFANRNIKATEFPKIVTSGLARENSGWSRAYIVRQAMSNLGVGSTALIALSEEVRKVHRGEYVDCVNAMLNNYTLTTKSVEWIWRRAIGAMKPTELERIVNSVVRHPNVTDEFIDQVLFSLKDSQLNDARHYTFRDGYLASSEVIQKINAINSNFDYFLANHGKAEDMTQAIVGDILNRGDADHIFALLKRDLIENETMKERAIITVVEDYDHVRELQKLRLIREDHVEMAARNGSWQLRRFAASSTMASEKTLKGLATDSDSDVRQAVRDNPKWKEIKEAVEYQKRVTGSIDLMTRVYHSATTVLDVVDSDGWEKDYEVSREFVQALRVLAKPEFGQFLEAFRSEDKRQMMKDGVDTETLDLLGQFFE
jgi:hypothetical protein